MSRHIEREVDFRFIPPEGLDLTPDLVINLYDIVQCWGNVKEPFVKFNHEDDKLGFTLYITGSTLPGVKSMNIFKSIIPRHGITLINIEGEEVEGFILWDNDLTPKEAASMIEKIDEAALQRGEAFLMGGVFVRISREVSSDRRKRDEALAGLSFDEILDRRKELKEASPQPRPGIKIAVVDADTTKLFIEDPENSVFSQPRHRQSEPPYVSHPLTQIFYHFLENEDFSALPQEVQETLRVSADEQKRNVPLEERTYILDMSQAPEEYLIADDEAWNFILTKREFTTVGPHLHVV